METTLNASGLREARVRFTVSSGDGPQGSGRMERPAPCAAWSRRHPLYDDSERVVTVPWSRNERGALTGVKSVSYAENVIALVHAKRQGAGEAIFGNTKGELCEGTGTNVFIVDGDTLRTPPLSSGCLAGVTRGLVIEVCRTHGIPVNEEPIPLSALTSAQEAFLTSSTREVHPISQVDTSPFLRSPARSPERWRGSSASSSALIATLAALTLTAPPEFPASKENQEAKTTKLT